MRLLPDDVNLLASLGCDALASCALDGVRASKSVELWLKVMVLKGRLGNELLPQCRSSKVFIMSQGKMENKIDRSIDVALVLVKERLSRP